MAALDVESSSSSHVNDSNWEGEQQHHYSEFDAEATRGGGEGRRRSSSVLEEDLEFEFLLPPSWCSPSPADQIISRGLLLPLYRPGEYKEKDQSTKKEAIGTPDRALSRCLSADSWTSCRTMFSSCPSRSSSASSSSCSSVTTLKTKTNCTTPSAAPQPVSIGLPPLRSRLTKRRQESREPKKGRITLASIPHKIAQLCLCLIAAACRRAAAPVSAANNGTSRSDKKAASSVASRDNRKKKGRRGMEGFSSAIQWCRADADVAAAENSIQEAVMHCKRSYARTG